MSTEIETPAKPETPKFQNEHILLACDKNGRLTGFKKVVANDMTELVPKINIFLKDMPNCGFVIASVDQLVKITSTVLRSDVGIPTQLETLK